MKTIQLVSCLVVLNGETTLLTRSDQIRREIALNSVGTKFTDLEGIEYLLPELTGKLVKVGQKLCAVGKKRPPKVKTTKGWDDDNY